MNRRFFFFGSLAFVGLAGCGSGSKPGGFEKLYEFVIDVGTPQYLNVARFVRSDGTVVSTSFSFDANSLESDASLWETSDFGRGSTERINVSSVATIPFDYDRAGDRYVSASGNHIRILDRNLNVVSDVPITPLGAGDDVSSQFVLDGDSLLFSPAIRSVKPDRSYRIGFDGNIKNIYPMPDGYPSTNGYANPFLVRGNDGNLYVGSAQKEITNLGSDGTSFEPTGLRSSSYLLIDSKGFAYGSDSKKIYKFNLTTRETVAEMSMPDEYVYFDSGFLPYRILLDAQDRLYVPIAPRGQRVLVFSTG